MNWSGYRENQVNVFIITSNTYLYLGVKALFDNDLSERLSNQDINCQVDLYDKELVARGDKQKGIYIVDVQSMDPSCHTSSLLSEKNVCLIRPDIKDRRVLRGKVVGSIDSPLEDFFDYIYNSVVALVSGTADKMINNKLNKRDEGLIKLILRGKTAHQIGRILNISHKTVYQRRASLFSKLEVDITADFFKLRNFIPVMLRNKNISYDFEVMNASRK
ncbi:TPA: helix-turn-helix transcriptional regulator [Serratia fonticola]